MTDNRNTPLQTAEHFDPFWVSILRINSGLWSVSTTYLFGHFEKLKCKDTEHKVVQRGPKPNFQHGFQFWSLWAGLAVRKNIFNFAKVFYFWGYVVFLVFLTTKNRLSVNMDTVVASSVRTKKLIIVKVRIWPFWL